MLVVLMCVGGFGGFGAGWWFWRALVVLVCAGGFDVC